MLFALICKDKAGHLQTRLDARPDHAAFLDKLNGYSKLAFAGPFLDAEGKPVAERYTAAAELLAMMHGRKWPYRLEAVPGVFHDVPPFDRDANGGFSVSLEAAHSLPRVARVGGDGAGRAILSAVVAAVRATKAIEIWEDGRLRGLIRDVDGRVRGAVIERRGGRLDEVFAPAVVLATGGIGGLFEATTNPSALRGEGLALAYQAGSEVLDPEFVQFHPTAIDVGLDPAPLATEALRGEGARLVDGEGAFLLGDHPDADLAPRDIVARAVHAARVEGRGAFLDATKAVGEAFPHEFPAVFAACMRAGLDPRVSPIPVAAAAHYHMGGIVADDEGRTSVPGLFAIGECAATGVHGANRLASNSLLEAGAFGRRAGRAAAAEAQPERRSLAAVQAMTDLPSEALATLRAAMTRHAGVVRARIRPCSRLSLSRSAPADGHDQGKGGDAAECLFHLDVLHLARRPRSIPVEI